ncbi:hypothetical protein SAMN06265377_3168 [Flagellimonas pacifica]|uniref:MlpB protein n=2 Tax=Flagellimonas pacifica TaxID=1247520 RepID=A0A285MVV7_9FLAO|nr:hypothetical protein SAMN06265377_3168 [Allomuricauda parva]
MIKQVIIGCLALFSLMGCKTDSKKIETEIDGPLTAVADQKASMDPQEYRVGSQVPKDLVCMVNDAYMGKAQIPVPVNGKTYYGCCQMCVKTLNTHLQAREGIDLYSKRPVDKTEAYIVLMNEEGQVAYFESKESYMNFKKQR